MLFFIKLFTKSTIRVKKLIKCIKMLFIMIMESVCHKNSLSPRPPTEKTPATLGFYSICFDWIWSHICDVTYVTRSYVIATPRKFNNSSVKQFFEGIICSEVFLSLFKVFEEVHTLIIMWDHRLVAFLSQMWRETSSDVTVGGILVADVTLRLWLAVTSLPPDLLYVGLL